MNTQPELVQREATLLADLRKLIDERIAAEKQMHAGFRSRTESAEREYAEGRQRVDTLEQQDRSRIETEYADARQRTTSRFESEHGPLEGEYQSVQREIAHQYETNTAAARTEFEEAEWLNVSVWEENQKGSLGGFDQWQRDVQERVERLRALWEESGQLLEQYRQGDLRTAVTCEPEPVPAGRRSAAPAASQRGGGGRGAGSHAADVAAPDVQRLAAPVDPAGDVRSAVRPGADQAPAAAGCGGRCWRARWCGAA